MLNSPLPSLQAVYLHEMNVVISCLQRSSVPESHKAALLGACKALLDRSDWADFAGPRRALPGGKQPSGCVTAASPPTSGTTAAGTPPGGAKAPREVQSAPPRHAASVSVLFTAPALCPPCAAAAVPLAGGLCPSSGDDTVAATVVTKKEPAPISTSPHLAAPPNRKAASAAPRASAGGKQAGAAGGGGDEAGGPTAEALLARAKELAATPVDLRDATWAMAVAETRELASCRWREGRQEASRKETFLAVLSSEFLNNAQQPPPPAGGEGGRDSDSEEEEDIGGGMRVAPVATVMRRKVEAELGRHLGETAVAQEALDTASLLISNHSGAPAVCFYRPSFVCVSVCLRGRSSCGGTRA